MINDPVGQVYGHILRQHREAARRGDEAHRAFLFDLADRLHTVFPDEVDEWDRYHGGDGLTQIPVDQFPIRAVTVKDPPCA